MSKLLSVVDFSHLMIKRFEDLNGIAIDMTLGNGNDTLVLCDYFKFVYGFDIQKEAIYNSEQLLQYRDNYLLIQDSHENIDTYINGEVALGIYNLGYLPNSDLSIVTQASSTISSLKKLFSMLKRHGLVLIVVYHAHDKNKEEARAISEFIKELDSVCYHITRYDVLNNEDAPYVLCIHKKK